LLILWFNVSQMQGELRTIYQAKQVMPYSFSGHKFLGLEEIFKDVAYAGYYTDKDMEELRNATQFAQAQLILAPTILDLNNLGHEYTIFDCSSPELAFQKIKEAGLKPLKKNQFGIILAKRKP